MVGGKIAALYRSAQGKSYADLGFQASDDRHGSLFLHYVGDMVKTLSERQARRV